MLSVPGDSNRHPVGFQLLFWGVLLTALLVRITALLALKKSIYFDFLLWDEQYYHDWAVRIADGTFRSSSVYEYAPLPAYMAALLYRLFSPDVLYVRLLNIFFDVLSCVVIYHIARQLMSRGWALIALLIAALTRELVFFSIVPLKTSLSILLFGLIVYFLLAALNRFSLWKVLLLGITLGLCLNVRPNVIILLPFLPLVLVIHLHAIKRSVIDYVTVFIVYSLGFMVAVAPFVWRNYQVAGEPALTSSQSGFLLYACNNEHNNSPYYQPVGFASSHPTEQGIQFTIEASRRMGRPLDSRQAAGYWRGQVLEETLNDPGELVQRLGNKILALLSFAGMDDHYHIPFLQSVLPFLTFPFIPWWPVFTLGLVSLLTGLCYNDKVRALALVFCLYELTLIIYSPGMRFQAVLLTIAIPMAVTFIRQAWSMYGNRDIPGGGRLILPVLGFLVIGLLPLSSTHDLSLAYNTHALVLDRNGESAKAVEYWQQSSNLNQPFSAVANLFLAGKMYQQGGLKESLYFLRKIPDNSFMVAAKYATIGDLMQHHGRYRDALAAYQKSNDFNSGQRRVRREVIKVLRRFDSEAVENEAQALRSIETYYKDQ